VYTGAKSIYDQLSDTDQYCTDALISNAQDLFSVAHNNHVDVFGIAPLTQVAFNARIVVHIQEAAFWSSE
jgi:hypothetical protein